MQQISWKICACFFLFRRLNMQTSKQLCCSLSLCQGPCALLRRLEWYPSGLMLVTLQIFSLLLEVLSSLTFLKHWVFPLINEFPLLICEQDYHGKLPGICGIWEFKESLGTPLREYQAWLTCESESLFKMDGIGSCWLCVGWETVTERGEEGTRRGEGYT